MFALMLDRVAEEEGRELLKQAELLNQDPNSAVPGELDQKCRKIIGKTGQKERRDRTRRWMVKTLRRVAMVAILAGLLFAVAYATIPEVRVGFLNLVLTVHEDSTDLSIQPGVLDDKRELNRVLYRYTLPEIPDGYDREVVNNETENSRMYWYETEAGDEFWILLEQGSETTKCGIDTENAAVTHVVVNGYDGICTEKNGTVQVAWADTERLVFISVYSSEFDEETVLKLAEAVKYVE